MPLLELIQVDGVRPVAERHLPGLVSTEMVAAPPGMSILDLAAYGGVTAAQLREFATALPAVPAES
jgi:hypothetical protein